MRARVQFIATMVGAFFLWGTAAGAQTCPNSCTPAITGPHDGVHTQFDGNSDAVLWPPNHKLRTIQISAVNNDGDACNITITDARQDEALDGKGDGNTSPDATNCSNTGNDSSIDLRAERAGYGTGRFYHVSFTMSDPDCTLLPAMDQAIILVPHDQGVVHLNAYVDEGPIAPSYSGAMLSCTQ
ncbi:MAG TPA: hypothetical protein VN634_04315 [Candidatus Limnocylindrales bacterium]|nr:hypothetical protein [Candidatus Limnocylindrales bacterium]